MSRNRVPAKRQTTFDSQISADDIEPIDMKEHTVPAPNDDDSTCTTVYSPKKRLSRTDSIIMIVQPSESSFLEDDESDHQTKVKPPPSPPILVENVHGAVKAISHEKPSVPPHHQASLGDARSPLPNYSSCPNLMNKDIVSSQLNKVRIRTSVSSDGRLCKTAPSATNSSRTSPGLLSVPNVFTTSFTHSKPVNRRLANVCEIRGHLEHQSSLESPPPSSGEERSREPRQHRFSAPELTNDTPELSELQEMHTKAPLTKSLSDNPHSPKTQQHQQSVSEPRVSMITEHLYLGNLECAHDERLLCRTKIGSVLDLSNLAPEDVPLTRKNIAPCTCGHASNHMRPVLRLTMCESDLVDIRSHFQRMNKFISGAYERKKKVLIYCDSSSNHLSALVAAQFLMQTQGMDFRRAISQIMKARSDIYLNPAYSALLQSLENELFKEEVEEEDLESEVLTPPGWAKPSSMLPKEAWSE